MIKKYLLLYFLIIISLSCAKDVNRTKGKNIELLIDTPEIINIKNFGNITVQGDFIYKNSKKMKMKGEISFPFRKNLTFPFKTIIKKIFNLKGELHVEKTVKIFFKDNTELKVGKNVLKSEKTLKGYLIKIPKKLFCKYPIVLYKSAKNTITIKYFEMIISDLILNSPIFIFKPITIKNGEKKFIEVKIIFNKKKSIENIEILKTNLTLEETKTFIKALKNAEITTNDYINKTLIFRYNFN